MQFLPSLSRRAQISAREHSAGAHLPYAAQIDDHTIQAYDGLLLQTIKLRGLLFETAETNELNYRLELRDAMLRTLASSRFAIYHHVIRRRVEPKLSSRFPDAFSSDLDEKWHARLSSRELFVNDLYLTIVRRPLPGSIGFVERIGRWFGGQSKDAHNIMAVELRSLNSAREVLMAALGDYEPQLLGLYDEAGAVCSEPIEFLSLLFNATSAPRRLPFESVGDYIPARRISFGRHSIELSAEGRDPRRFQAMISVKDYAGQTTPGMFDALLRLPTEMTLTQSFAFVERGVALGRMNLALRRMRSAEDEAITLRGELNRAKDDVAVGRAGFGEHHMTIAVHANNLESLNQHVAEVTAALGDLGIVGVREDVGLEPAYWAQFPGNFKYIARRGLVSTTNYAGLASSHNFAFGHEHGNHWGDAVTLLETTAAGPYFFNFHHGDLGNFTVIGPSGSGKTVVLNFLLAQARRFDPRIVFFDKDRGAELFIRAIDGRYDRLSPDVPSILNPLQMSDTPTNRQFLVDWVSQMAGGVENDERDQIAIAINANFEQPVAHRRLRHLVELFRGRARPTNRDLYSRLVPWWGEGTHAWLFDNAKDSFGFDERVIGVDMTAILDDPVARTPAMMVLFHRIEAALDGTPSIIVVDEGWKALDDDVFVRRIKDWEKTIRKRNGIIGFATQSARDALDSRIASSIIEQAATQIFMINPKASAEDYCEGFGLTAHELDLIRRLPDTSHCFLIRHGRHSVLARLDLTGEKDLLTILSGRERTVRLLDSIRQNLGDSPDAWLPELLQLAQ